MSPIAVRHCAVLAVASAVVVTACATGCGSRGPLDDGATVAAADASADVDTSANADAARDATPEVPVDAGHDASILSCATCLFQDCSQPILACVQSPPCQQAFQCVLQKCLGGGGAGGIDPGCLLKCASSSPQGALQVFQVFQCVTSTCGPDCGALLGGLGGLGGGGGGGGGGGRKDAGKMTRPPIASAFSRWPELCGPIEEPLAD